MANLADLEENGVPLVSAALRRRASGGQAEHLQVHRVPLRSD